MAPLIQTQGQAEIAEIPRRDAFGFSLSAWIYPDIELSLVALSVSTDLMVSQVADEVLYTRLIEMQGLAEAQGATKAPPIDR